MSFARTGGPRLLLSALAISALLLGTYLALGGATYKPLDVEDPCDPRPEPAASQDQLLQRVVLSALDGAACQLQVPREDLAIALADDPSRAEFAARYGISEDEVDSAVRAGLSRAVDDAQDRGEISSFEASLLGEAVDHVPVGTVIDALQSSAGKSVIDVVGGLVG